MEEISDCTKAAGHFWRKDVVAIDSFADAFQQKVGIDVFQQKSLFAPIRIHSVKSSLSSETVSMMTVSCGLILKI